MKVTRCFVDVQRHGTKHLGAFNNVRLVAYTLSFRNGLLFGMDLCQDGGVCFRPSRLVSI